MELVMNEIDIIDLLLEKSTDENADVNGKAIAEIIRLRRALDTAKEQETESGWEAEYRRNMGL